MNIPKPPSIRSDFFSTMAVSGSLKNMMINGIRNMTTSMTVAGSALPVI